jgi:hypothetical protein|tara:strand:- start:65 stop:340 length:276 start_codon:yes stop_codon:yes gene_type:complete
METENLVKTICPRCDGNGYIRISPVVATIGDTSQETDCPMCEETITHMGQRITIHNGYVKLPIEDTRKNIEGGRESKTKWSGETLPEVGKE